MLPTVSVLFTACDMQVLKNKTILIISPQSWGSMFVAKHHYAIELAKLGNEVYFLNPPDNNKWTITNGKKRIQIQPWSNEPNLFLIWHRLYFPYNLKFHAKKVFDFLIQKQVKDILSFLDKKVDIVWSFDLGNLYPLTNFKDAFKIFHPVDEPQNSEAIKAATNADILLAVTNEIIEKYRQFPIPKYFINHGVSEYFFDQKHLPGNDSVRVGLSGNLLRPDIDWNILLKIISENPKVTFEVWGNYDVQNGNLGGGSNEINKQFIQKLQTASNVILHGSVSPDRLPQELAGMDAFLICYDVQKDQSKGTNYHKIMEYLSTGKVVISNNVTTYRSEPGLIQMVNEREHNQSLPELFKNVINDLEKYNAPGLQHYRVSYAFENTYSKQIRRIERIINGEKD
jgi:hypothetical protein